MRLGPPSADSGAMIRCINQGLNPLDAPPHPQKLFYLTPISTPMQYQAIILAFRCLLASIGRGAAGRPRWFYSELVPRNGGPRLHNARPRLFRAASAGLWVPGHIVPPAWGSGRYSLDARPTSRACFVGSVGNSQQRVGYSVI